MVKDNITSLKPKNVKRCEETKLKQISILQQSVKEKSAEVRDMKQALEKKEEEKARLISEKVVLREKVDKLDKKLQKEKGLKLKAQKVASKWRRMDKTKIQKESW